MQCKYIFIQKERHKDINTHCFPLFLIRTPPVTSTHAWIIAPALEPAGFDHVTVSAGTLSSLLLDARTPPGSDLTSSMGHTPTQHHSCESIYVLTFPRDQLDPNFA